MIKELRNLYEEIDTKKEVIENLISGNKVTEANALMVGYKELQAKAETLRRKEDEARTNIPGGETKTNYNDSVKILYPKDKLTDQYTNTYTDKKPLSLGAYIKGCVTGNWIGADREREEFKALSTTGGNVLIPTLLSSAILDLARNKSILFGKVPMIPMLSNNLTIAKIKTDPAFGFKAELDPAIETDFTFEGVDLKSKTVYGLMKVSLEMLGSAANLDSVISNAAAQAIAVAIDKALLFGDGVKEPKGILTYDEINKVTATSIDYDFFIQAIGKIREANGEPTDMCVNATTDTILNTLKNGEGEYQIIPKVITDLKRSISNQLPKNTGVGTNESIAMVYDTNSIVIGLQNNLVLEVSREAGFADGSVYLRLYAMLDCIPTRPTFITKISGLK